MSSEDDYYVELYERHAERKGRRARRRGSGGSTTKADYRNNGGKSGRRPRRPRTWLVNGFIRLAGVCFVALLAVYEFNLLFGARETERIDKNPGAIEDHLLEGAADKVLPKSGKRRWVSAKASKLETGANSASESEKKKSLSALDSSNETEISLPVPASVNGAAAVGIGASGKKIYLPAAADALKVVPRDAPQEQKDVSAPTTSASTTTNAAPTSKTAITAVKLQKGDKSALESSDGNKELSSGTKAGDIDKFPADDSVIKAKPTSSKSDKKRRKKKKKKVDTSEENSDRENPGQNSSREKVDVIPAEDKSFEDNAADGESFPRKMKEEEPEVTKKPHKRPSRPIPGNETESTGAEPGAKENFWQWFQDSKGAETSGSGSIECPKDHERLCQMFYKYLRKHKVRAIFDASCGKNLDWIKIPLSKVGNELWGFKYYCGEPNEEKMIAAKEALKEFSFVEFDDRQWWRAGFPEGVEMLFAWDVLAHTAFGRVWSFFVNVRKQDIKWILVDNYPALANDPSPKREFINLRKHPFRFPAPAAVVQDVREPGEATDVKRQLLLYEGSQLPDNLA